MMGIAVLSLRMTSMCDPGKRTPRAKTSSGGGGREVGGGEGVMFILFPKKILLSVWRVNRASSAIVGPLR